MHEKVDDKIGSGVSRSERHEAHAAYGQKDQHSGTSSLTLWQVRGSNPPTYLPNLHLIMAFGSLTRLHSLLFPDFTRSHYIA